MLKSILQKRVNLLPFACLSVLFLRCLLFSYCAQGRAAFAPARRKCGLCSLIHLLLIGGGRRGHHRLSPILTCLSAALGHHCTWKAAFRAIFNFYQCTQKASFIVLSIFLRGRAKPNSFIFCAERNKRPSEKPEDQKHLFLHDGVKKQLCVATFNRRYRGLMVMYKKNHAKMMETKMSHFPSSSSSLTWAASS